MISLQTYDTVRFYSYGMDHTVRMERYHTLYVVRCTLAVRYDTVCMISTTVETTTGTVAL